MKVQYVFSRSNKIGSRLIAWAAKFEQTGLEQLPSHVAALLDETWVFESTMQHGVRVVPYTEWLKINEQLYKFDAGPIDSKNVLETAASLWGRKYDWKGIVYFTWRYLGLILLRRPMPAKNHWQSNGAYFCTEFIAMLEGADYSMTSPARLCASLMHKEEKKNESKERT